MQQLLEFLNNVYNDFNVYNVFLISQIDTDSSSSSYSIFFKLNLMTSLSLKSSSRLSSYDLRDCSSGVKSNCMFFNASTPNLGWLMFVVLKPIQFIFISLPTFPRSLFLKYYTRFGFTLSFPLLVTHGSSSISSIQSLFVGSLQRIYRIKSLACQFLIKLKSMSFNKIISFK